MISIGELTLTLQNVQEKPQWWKRKASILKVHMLLLAHLAREEIPPSLAADMRWVPHTSNTSLLYTWKIPQCAFDPLPACPGGWSAVVLCQIFLRVIPMHGM